MQRAKFESDNVVRGHVYLVNLRRKRAKTLQRAGLVSSRGFATKAKEQIVAGQRPLKPLVPLKKRPGKN